jgi:hypothetical protein
MRNEELGMPPTHPTIEREGGWEFLRSIGDPPAMPGRPAEFDISGSGNESVPVPESEPERTHDLFVAPERGWSVPTYGAFLHRVSHSVWLRRIGLGNVLCHLQVAQGRR